MGSTEIAKQVIYIFVVSFCFYILYFKILSSVFVLGIKSHKLLPTLFLEGCSDSDGNRLEIARGMGRVVSNAGRWTTWISRWFLGKVTTPKSGSVRSARELTPTPHLLCHGVSMGSQHLRLLEQLLVVKPT